MDVWALRVLVEVAEHGSFSGAGETLLMTQPAVSRQVATLERRLGVRLFDREPRGVRPTQAGVTAIEGAQEVLARIAALEAQLRAFESLEGGRVRLCAFPSAHTSFVPEAIRLFATRYPQVEISLLDIDSREAVDAVRAGRVDLALVTDWDLPAAAKSIELVPLLNDELLVALPAEHPLARTGRVRLRDLRAETWIEGGHPDCLGPPAELARTLGGNPRIGYTCDDWNGKQGLVAAGVGVMLFPTLAVPSARPDIALLPPHPRLAPRRIHAVAPSPQYRPPGVAALLNLLTELADTPKRTASN